MKNLENYGVQELSAKEVIKVDGGGNPFTDWVVGEIIGALVDFAFSDLDEFGEYAYANSQSHGGNKW